MPGLDSVTAVFILLNLEPCARCCSPHTMPTRMPTSLSPFIGFWPDLSRKKSKENKKSKERKERKRKNRKENDNRFLNYYQYVVENKTKQIRNV